MTTEQLKQTRDAMTAHLEGKPIQYRYLAYENDPWRGITNPRWDLITSLYRPKPEPHTVPWSKPEHVPGPVCWLRLKDRNHDSSSLEAMIVAVSSSAITVRTNDDVTCHYSKLEQFEHSTDRKQWLPCTIEVSEP